MEQLQGELFDEEEDQPVMAHLLGRKNKATAFGGGTFTQLPEKNYQNYQKLWKLPKLK